jgi:hypothetical protein
LADADWRLVSYIDIDDDIAFDTILHDYWLLIHYARHEADIIVLLITYYADAITPH